MIGTAANSTWPCVLCGAGVAGLSAALWLHDYGIQTLWLSPDGEMGGILRRVYYPIRNYAGQSWPTGLALVEDLNRQMVERSLPNPEAGSVQTIECHDDAPHRVHLERICPDHGKQIQTIQAQVIILATGTQYRTLGIPGEQNLLGTLVSQSVSRDGARFAGRSVGIVGGGDAGFENALMLAERHGCQVRMLLRNAQFRARREFVERVQAHSNIRFHPVPTVVTQIRAVGNQAELGLQVQGREETLRLDGLFVRIGMEPVLPRLSTPLLLDPSDYVQVDTKQCTSIPRILAAGDVTAHPLKAIATAVGAGAQAAHTAAIELDTV